MSTAAVQTKQSDVKKPISPASLFAAPEKRAFVLSLLLIVATLTIYNQVSHNPFINCDDDRYVTENPYIRGGLNWATVKWALTSTGQAGFWHPLTWLSHALDVQLFGFNAAGHHFVSLLIHSVNVVLLFLLLTRATKKPFPSLVVAALYAVHPLNVESVAWAAERKNVLCTFFFLAALGAYGWYAIAPTWKRYAVMTGIYICSLASKPMAVTFPFALLLLDWWPLARLRGADHAESMKTRSATPAWLMAEKIPLLLLSAATSIVTMAAQRAAGATRSSDQFRLAIRLQNALVAYATYVWKIFWPSHLTPVYPHPGNTLSAGQVVVSAAFLLAVTSVIFLLRRRYLLAGWFWFLGILFPSIGLVQVGDQALADRFAYISEIGVFVMVVWGLSEILDAMNIPPLGRAIPTAAAILVLASVTYRQIGFWRSSYDLWSHALTVTQNNFIAEDNLGGALIQQGREEEAHQHFEMAAEINPKDPLSRNNLGTYALTHNEPRAAVVQYEAAASVTSDSGLLAQIYANLGGAYRALGENDRARTNYDQALRYNPNQFNAWLGLGLLAQKQGKNDEAIRDFMHSLELNPTAQGYVALGHSFAYSRRNLEALAAYQQALKIAPDLAEAQQAVTGLNQQKR